MGRIHLVRGLKQILMSEHETLMMVIFLMAALQNQQRHVYKALKDTNTNHFNMVSGFVKSNQKLDTITCTKYSLTITATDGTVSPNPTGTCTLVIEVTNVNDAPSYIPLGLVDRAIYERSSVTVVLIARLFW